MRRCRSFRLPCALLVTGAAYCRSSLNACAFAGWGPSQLKGFASFRARRGLAPSFASAKEETAHILSIATEYRQEAVILQRSAKLLGYKFQFCGFREKWVGWGTKLVQYRKALRLGLAKGQIAASDPVLLIDGWDCVLVGPASEFIEKLSMAPFTDGPQPWYAGERICGPDFFKANRIDAVYPDPGTPWRYPNAGCMTGRAEPVLKLIEDLLDGAGDGDTFPEDGDDQGRLHEHLLELVRMAKSCHTSLIQSVAFFSVSTKQSLSGTSNLHLQRSSCRACEICRPGSVRLCCMAMAIPDAGSCATSGEKWTSCEGWA